MRWMLAATLGLAACSAGNNGERDAQPSNDAALRDFTGVTLSSSDEVEIVQGPAFAIQVEGTEAAKEGLEIRRDGDMLKIGRKSGNFWGKGDDGARIRVTMPTIAAAALAGSGDMTIGQVRGDRAALTVTGTVDCG